MLLLWFFVMVQTTIVFLAKEALIEKFGSSQKIQFEFLQGECKSFLQENKDDCKNAKNNALKALCKTNFDCMQRKFEPELTFTGIFTESYEIYKKISFVQYGFACLIVSFMVFILS